MWRYRRLLVFVLLMLLAVPLIAACGGGDDDDDDEAARTGTVSGAVTGTSSSASPTTAGEGVATARATETTASASGSPTAASGAPTTGATEDAAVPTATTAAEPGVTPTASPRTTGIAHGFNIFARGDRDGGPFNEQTIAQVQASGFNWVRIQIYWRDVQREPEWWDPLPIDRIVEQYSAAGINILASVSNPPDWALDPSGEQLLADYGAWETFMGFLADRYQGRIQAWEIWNEQNLASTMRGTVRLEDYAQLLEFGYNGAKKAAPDSMIVFGGLTPTGVNDPTIAINDVEYLRAFYDLEGGRYRNFFDVLGAHANATNNPPDTLWPDNPGTGDWSDDPSFYFRRAEQLQAIMAEYGDERPVWLTEFGWTTANQAPGYEYGADITEQEQADYLVQAFAYAQEHWPWCTGMFVWNLNFATITQPEDEKFPWSVLNADWSPRPAFEALSAMPKE